MRTSLIYMIWSKSFALSSLPFGLSVWVCLSLYKQAYNSQSLSHRQRCATANDKSKTKSPFGKKKASQSKSIFFCTTVRSLFVARYEHFFLFSRGSRKADRRLEQKTGSLLTRLLSQTYIIGLEEPIPLENTFWSILSHQY